MGEFVIELNRGKLVVNMHNIGFAFKIEVNSVDVIKISD